jgi:hypothetical protein
MVGVVDVDPRRRHGPEVLECDLVGMPSLDRADVRNIGAKALVLGGDDAPASRSQVAARSIGAATSPPWAWMSCPAMSERKVRYRKGARSKMSAFLACNALFPNVLAPRKRPSSNGMLNRGSPKSGSASVLEMSFYFIPPGDGTRMKGAGALGTSRGQGVGERLFAGKGYCGHGGLRRCWRKVAY